MFLDVTSSWQFRLVILRGGAGHQHEAWARLFFGGGRSPEVSWHPDLGIFNEQAERPDGEATSEIAPGAAP